MPMFQLAPRKDAAIAGVEGRADVLALDTAVKHGVLGVDGDGEKLDLEKMIQELSLSEVPSVFICPISLEPMQDPVTLCTGQTYERSNILRWLRLGHYTCPTTMQELWDDTVTPNTTLHHLAHSWFSQKYIQMKKNSDDAQGRASELLVTLKKAKGQSRVHSLKQLRLVVANHPIARKTVAEEGGVALLSALLGPFTSHSVGSQVVAILVNLSLSPECKLSLMQPARISLLVDILNEGSLETKINCVRLIEILMESKDFRAEIVLGHSLLVALMRLVRDQRHPNGLCPGLELLKSICLSHKQARALVVSIGAVPQLIDLMQVLNPNCLELALSVLDAVSSEIEGRRALKDCTNTIPTMVRLIMRVSETCTGRTLSILLSVCKLSPEECSRVAVEGGLATKLLLVMQSGCGPFLKQQAAELLKLCSLNCSDTVFISKCKLTRTIQ